MRNLEVLARVLVLVAVFGLPAAVFGYQRFVQPQRAGGFALVGAEGRWNTQELRVKQGERVRLRITSDDVLHGFQLEGYGIKNQQIYPGKVKVVEFVADRPGTYPFTCTVVCSVSHSHMEGVLTVVGDGANAKSVPGN